MPRGMLRQETALPTMQGDEAAQQLVAQAPGSAHAQTPSPAAGAAAPPQVDETALRYFARAGDTRRLEAEIARLRALYPDWTPPENPLDVPDAGDPELDRMWELYSQGRYGEVREAIAARQESQPGWQPPADLLDRLAVAEARQRLVNASNLQQYETVVRVAAETPSLLTCSEVDVLWRVARAFVETDRSARALDAYRYILTNCDDSGERLASVQMASQQLDRPALDQLLELERTDAQGIGEFASLRLDIARQGVAAAGEDADTVASPEDLSLLNASAAETGSASDLLLLGWYELTHGDGARAEDFFRRSNAASPSADAARGLALALLDLDRAQDAEAAVRPYAEDSDESRAVYAAAAASLLAQEPTPPLSAEQLTRIVAVTAALREANTAQQLGWYSYALNQFATAGQWFETALAWKPDEEPAAFGLALARERLGDASGLAQLKAAWSPSSPRIAAVGQGPAGAPSAIAANAPAPASTRPAAAPATTFVAPAQPQAASSSAAQMQASAQPTASAAATTSEPLRAARQGGGASRTAGCRSTVDPRTLSPDAALSRGWCLMEIDRPLEAAPAFEVALLSRSDATRRDAAYGQSLAYLRAGLSDKAAVAATKAPQPRERQLELEIALLTDQATSAFESRRPVETLMALDERARIAPERLDLMVLRGYAYLELRRYRDAERVFAAAARAGSREGARGVNAVREARGEVSSGG
ncbi:cellulose synthase [Aureimonas populi]|uniref:Cellulose synthase n=1 Tax=Aureimonas populi TaxID=1701758 RepID=A0ABW5CHC3_9HYPH|nr:cellulose synthase [Aureimonas populi]